MRKGTICIINKLGLHARAAAKLVSVTSRYSSDIRMGDGTRMVNAKSIMSVMMLAASRGTELLVEVEGSDEEQAYNGIEELINNRFDEAE